MRFIKVLLAGIAGLMAAPSGAQPAMPVPAVPPGHATWADYKQHAAQRIAAANPGEMFSGPLPDTLKSIPVLQVQLNADGSLRGIVVVRTPQAVPGTVEMASQAIRRAAPFAPVGHLPRPWHFSETFLYNDDLKFQLRTLAETP